MAVSSRGTCCKCRAAAILCMTCTRHTACIFREAGTIVTVLQQVTGSGQPCSPSAAFGSHTTPLPTHTGG